MLIHSSVIVVNVSNQCPHRISVGKPNLCSNLLSRQIPNGYLFQRANAGFSQLIIIDIFPHRMRLQVFNGQRLYLL